MEIIQEWKNKKNTRVVQLFSDKILSFSLSINGERVFVQDLSFEKFFLTKVSFLSVEEDYPIFKKVAEFVSPAANWKELAIKKWLFWKHINNEKIEEDIFLFENEEENDFLYKSKFGFAKGTINIENKINMRTRQALDNFFFYGPYFPEVSLKDRIKIKQEIFDNLDAKSGISLNDGFVLFDYNKIKKVFFERTDENKYHYFKIEKGKAVSGGAVLTMRDCGGEMPYPIEYLYYNLNFCIPKIFHDGIDYVKSILEKAIIQY